MRSSKYGWISGERSTTISCLGRVTALDVRLATSGGSPMARSIAKPSQAIHRVARFVRY